MLRRCCACMAALLRMHGHGKKEVRVGQRPERYNDTFTRSLFPSPSLRPSFSLSPHFIVMVPCHVEQSMTTVLKLKSREKTPLPGAVSAHKPEGTP